MVRIPVKLSPRSDLTKMDRQHSSVEDYYQHHSNEAQMRNKNAEESNSIERRNTIQAAL